MRINKFLSRAGIASRRNAEQLVLDKRIKVNSKIMTDLAYKVDIKNDIVEFDNNIVSIVEEKYYLMLNKPVDYTSTNKSQFGEKIIYDLIDIDTKLFSIGRLDKDSRGLILITNDGDLYNNLIHPRSEIFKEYKVKINKPLKSNDRLKLENGVDIGGYITNKSIIKYIEEDEILVKINEGKNRQIRRMFASLDYDVLDLNRLAIGNLRLGDLPIGEYRKLTVKEIEYLKSI